jgi:hypothetical protein
MKRILLACLLLVACGQQDYWYVDMPNYRPGIITITEVDDIQAACRKDKPVDGCVNRLPTMAVVYVRKGLKQSAYECVLLHEIGGHVIKGMNHDDRANYSPDCGPKV